jgi:two-component system, LuxR family, sensor kinase FixL
VPNVLPRKQRSGEPHELVGRLALRYVLVLVAVALLVAVDQAVLQPMLIRLDGYAPVINLAGRQRMLSQKIAKSSLAIYLLEDSDDVDSVARVAELQAALNLWFTTQAGLRYGDAQLELPGTQSPPLVSTFESMEPHVSAIRDSAERLVAHHSTRTESEASLQSLTARSSNSLEIRQEHSNRLELMTILRHERPYLELMDQAVRLLESEARRRVFWLRTLGLSAMITVLGLLTVVGACVVRPATRLITDQMRDLERRVADRTAELTRANESLRRESEQRLAIRQQLDERSHQLAHLSRVRAMGELASGLAHELNQPLGAVANYANTCELHLDRESCDRDTLRKAIGGLRRSAMRAGEIVRRMRSFVRPGDASKEATDMHDLVKECIELCRPELRRRNIGLQFEAKPGPLEVLADSIQIQQVVINLLQNAIQAVDSVPRESRRIMIHLRNEGESVNLTISDTGPGLAPEAFDMLFHPFYSTKPEGLGLGLPISRSIVQEHAGSLSASAREGGGARFTLSLPCLRTS